MNDWLSGWFKKVVHSRSIEEKILNFLSVMKCFILKWKLWNKKIDIKLFHIHPSSCSLWSEYLELRCLHLIHRHRCKRQEWKTCCLESTLQCKSLYTCIYWETGKHSQMAGRRISQSWLWLALPLLLLCKASLISSHSCLPAPAPAPAAAATSECRCKNAATGAAILIKPWLPDFWDPHGH